MKIKNVVILLSMVLLGAALSLASGHLIAKAVVVTAQACIKNAVKEEPHTKEEVDAALANIENCLTTFQAHRRAVIGFYLGN